MNNQIKSSKLPEMVHQIPVYIPCFLCCIEDKEVKIFEDTGTQAAYAELFVAI